MMPYFVTFTFTLILILSTLTLAASAVALPSATQELTSTDTTPAVAHYNETVHFNETEHKGGGFKGPKGPKHGGHRSAAAGRMLGAGDFLGMTGAEVGLLMLVAGVMARFA